MDTIWKLVCERDFDGLLRFVPDNVLDAAAAMRPSTESDDPLSFADVVNFAFTIRGFTFDSFAQRHLFHSPPTRGSVTRLSCMRTAPDRAVLRFGLRAESGERAVLTFALQCDEMLSPHYRSARIDYVWQFASVTGEAAGAQWSPDADADTDAHRHTGGNEAGHSGGGCGAGGMEHGEYPLQPHPSLPPEAVVEAQLAALLVEDAATVFAFASPSNQAVTGPLERFATLLRNPMYRPLLRHRRATPYRRTMVTPESYSETVQIVSENTGMPQAIEAVYAWEVQLQGPGAGHLANCWLTNSVRLLDAQPLSS